ncbi:hypothetical protein ACFVYV_44175 [Streptomyces mirabilis]|uniref:hypothetical protein n=1 Tax=Streptomyces mirabilis TaxID=68239 RepID=UPI0036D932AF
MYALSYGVGYHMLGPYFEAVLRQVRAVDSDDAIELRRAIGFLERQSEDSSRPGGYANRSTTTCAWSTAPTARTPSKSPRP